MQAAATYVKVFPQLNRPSEIELQVNHPPEVRSQRTSRTPEASTSARSANVAKRERSKVIFCGGTAIPRTIDFATLAEIAREVEAILVADIAHIAGLIVGRAPHRSATPR